MTKKFTDKINTVYHAIVGRRGLKWGFIMLCLFIPGAGFAQNTTPVLEGFAQVAAMIVNIITLLAMLLLNYGGMLLDTEMLIGEDVMESIRPLWVYVRNVTNIAFVLVLLFLSFSNLFAAFGVGEGGKWTIKDKLPKVIIALIAINFSLLGFRVVIEAVNIATITVFSLADTAIEDETIDTLNDLVFKKEFQATDPSKICEGEGKDGESKCQSFADVLNYAFCPPMDPNNEKNPKPCKDARFVDTCIICLDEEAPFSEKSQTSGNLMMAFGVYFNHIEQLPKLAANFEAKSWVNVVDSVLFSGIMALAFLVALIALFIVLLVRVVILWMAMVFSPVLVAAQIMGMGGMTGDIGKKILNSLIVPIKVAAVFAVSFVLIFAMTDFTAGLAEGGMVKFGVSLSKFGNEYSVLWQIMSIIVFWVAVFAALKGTYADKAVEMIKGGAEKIGGYVAKSATVDQAIIPTFNGEKTSLTMLGRMPDLLQTERGTRLGKQRENLEAALNMKTNTKAVNDLADAIRNTTYTTAKQKDFLTTVKNKGGREAFDLRNDIVSEKFQQATGAKDKAKWSEFVRDYNKAYTRGDSDDKLAQILHKGVTEAGGNWVGEFSGDYTKLTEYLKGSAGKVDDNEKIKPVEEGAVKINGATGAISVPNFENLTPQQYSDLTDPKKQLFKDTLKSKTSSLSEDDIRALKVYKDEWKSVLNDTFKDNIEIRAKIGLELGVEAVQVGGESINIDYTAQSLTKTTTKDDIKSILPDKVNLDRVNDNATLADEILKGVDTSGWTDAEINTLRSQIVTAIEEERS